MWTFSPQRIMFWSMSPLAVWTNFELWKLISSPMPLFSTPAKDIPTLRACPSCIHRGAHLRCPPPVHWYLFTHSLPVVFFYKVQRILNCLNLGIDKSHVWYGVDEKCVIVVSRASPSDGGGTLTLTQLLD